jgi:hypothetical protein
MIHGHELKVYGTMAALCEMYIAVLNELIWHDRSLVYNRFYPIVDILRSDVKKACTVFTQAELVMVPRLDPKFFLSWMACVDVIHKYALHALHALHAADVATYKGHAMINMWEDFKTISSMTTEDYIGPLYDWQTGKLANWQTVKLLWYVDKRTNEIKMVTG